MGLNIENVDLLSLQTLQMQQDPTTIAMCVALNPKFQEVASGVQKCLIIPNVDTLTEEILDELAYELHVDWYDATASIEVKRRLIKNSDIVHMSLGTPFAVEQVVQDYFGDGYMQEWFEYGGQPYKFKIITSNSAVTAELANQFTNAINAVKRGSTYLDQIIISLTSEIDMYFCGVVQTGDYLTIGQVI